MDVMKRSTGLLKEFRTFTLRGNALDLAVGVVIGAAFAATVNSFVKSLLTPLISAIFGKADFSSLTFTINNSVFYYGEFLNALISFVCIAFAIFFFVVKPQSTLRHRLGYDPPTEQQKAACPRCVTDIPVEATRCPSCTSDLEANWSAVVA
jgi:large conductance mechanosensitive channel